MELKPNVLTAIAIAALVLSAIGAGAGLMALTTSGTEGPAGPEGPAGETGPVGPEGEAGYGFASFVMAAHDSIDNQNADFVCDGEDDQNLINAAISSLPEQGGSVYLREGTFVLSGGINIARSNVTIMGSGAGTVLKVEDDLNGTMTVLRASNCDSVMIRDLSIDGNADKNVEGSYDGLVFDHCSDSRVAGVRVRDLKGVGMELSSCYLMTVENSGVRDSGSCGIMVNYSVSVSVSGSILQSCVAESVLLDHSRDCTVQENQILYGGSHGVRLEFSNYNLIDNNIVRGAETNGLFLEDSYYNAISGNQLFDSGNWGVLMSSYSEHNAVVGNSISSSGYDGIRTEESLGNSITSNMLLDSGWAGMIVYDSDDTVVSDNVIDRCFYSGISVYNSNRVIVSGNTLTHADEHGIQLQSSDDCVVSVNAVSGNSYRVDNSYSGIYIAGDSDYNLIDGNTVRIGYTFYEQRYGLYIQASFCNSNMVINNDLYDSGSTTDYLDDGTGTIYHNNRLSTGWVP